VTDDQAAISRKMEENLEQTFTQHAPEDLIWKSRTQLQLQGGSTFPHEAREL